MTRRKPQASPPNPLAADEETQGTPYAERLQSLNLPPRGAPGSPETAKREAALLGQMVPPRLGVLIVPAQASAIMEDVANCQRVIAAYALGTASWDDLLYHADRLYSHLHGLLSHAGAVPAPPAPDPEPTPDSVLAPRD